MSLGRSGIVGLALALLNSSPSRAGAKLITNEEAGRPPPVGAVVVDMRGVLRGPKLDLISPDTAIRSPLHLQIRFEAFGGTNIDPDSIKVTYLRTPNVDLTERLKHFSTISGIDMPDAEVPAGDHMIRVDVKDTAGHPASASYVLKVLP